MITYIGVKEIQCVEKKILEHFVQYCEAHEYRYMIVGGTLIGAVRHKGFIPWDDDIDVYMPRGDYEHFIRNYDLTGNRFAVMDYRNTDRYFFRFAKFVDIKTRKVEQGVKDFGGGICIDIFPLDLLGNDIRKIQKVIKKLLQINRLLFIKEYLPLKTSKLYKRIGLLLLKIMLYPINSKELVKKYHQRILSLKEDENKYCGNLALLMYGDKDVYEYEWFKNDTVLSFEGLNVNAPAGYKEYLARVYGEYMKLPPVDKRVSHHNYSAWINNTSDILGSIPTDYNV